MLLISNIAYALNVMASNQCEKILKTNYQCTRHRTLGSSFCWQHKPLVKKQPSLRSTINDPNLPIRSYFPNKDNWIKT